MWSAGAMRASRKPATRSHVQFRLHFAHQSCKPHPPSLPGSDPSPRLQPRRRQARGSDILWSPAAPLCTQIPARPHSSDRFRRKAAPSLVLPHVEAMDISPLSCPSSLLRPWWIRSCSISCPSCAGHALPASPLFRPGQDRSLAPSLAPRHYSRTRTSTHCAHSPHQLCSAGSSRSHRKCWRVKNTQFP